MAKHEPVNPELLHTPPNSRTPRCEITVVSTRFRSKPLPASLRKERFIYGRHYEQTRQAGGESSSAKATELLPDVVLLPQAEM